jgi:hypothetical protein
VEAVSPAQRDLIPAVHATTLDELRDHHEDTVGSAASYLEDRISEVRAGLAAGRIPERPIMRAAAELDRAVASLRAIADTEKISGGSVAQ